MNAEQWLVRGDELRETDKEQAVTAYTKAIQADPALDAAWFKRALTNAELRHVSEAVADLNKLIELESPLVEELKQIFESVVEVHLSVAESAIEDGDLHFALTKYNEANIYDSNCVEAYLGRGIVLEELGKLDDAMTEYTQATLLDPKSADAYRNRGQLSVKRGMPREGVADLTTAINNAPNDPTLYRARAVALTVLREEGAARQDLEKADELETQANESEFSSADSSGTVVYVRDSRHEDEESLARRQRSIDILRTEGVPFIEQLPVLESAAESPRRTADEAVERSLALTAVAMKADELPPEFIDVVLDQLRISSVASPMERRFLESHASFRRDRALFSWRYEALWVMLWALEFFDELARPDEPCDASQAIAILRGQGVEGLKNRGLRPQREILDWADLIYRYNWAVVDAKLKDRSPPAGLLAGVVRERHLALNWLTTNLPWDDVTTDT